MLNSFNKGSRKSLITGKSGSKALFLYLAATPHQSIISIFPATVFFFYSQVALWYKYYFTHARSCDSLVHGPIKTKCDCELPTLRRVSQAPVPSPFIAFLQCFLSSLSLSVCLSSRIYLDIIFIRS